MVDTTKLRGAIKAKGLTIAETAQMIGISEATMQRKLKSGVFGTDEMEKMINLLSIRRPYEIFFAQRYPEKIRK